MYELHEALTSGFTLGQIAEYYGVHQTTVSRWRDSEAYRKFQAELHREAIRKLADNVTSDLGEAFATLREVMATAPFPADRLNAARELIKLHGFVGLEREHSKHENAGVDVEELGEVVLDKFKQAIGRERFEVAPTPEGEA